MRSLEGASARSEVLFKVLLLIIFNHVFSQLSAALRQRRNFPLWFSGAAAASEVKIISCSRGNQRSSSRRTAVDANANKLQANPAY